jgi:hypothetical protein
VEVVLSQQIAQPPTTVSIAQYLSAIVERAVENQVATKWEVADAHAKVR